MAEGNWGMDHTDMQHPQTAGNENTGLLKVIAIIFMMIDHAGAIFFPKIMELRVLGRIAFPLYAWCAVVGVCYTRNMGKYALRLLVLGIVSQPFYVLALSHDWAEWNIFATLLLGILALWGIREKKWGSQIWAPVLALLISCMVEVDYSWKGIAVILLLYMARKNRGGLIAALTTFCLYWGSGTVGITHIFGIRLPVYYSFMPHGSSLLSAITKVQFWAILSLPLIAIPMGKKMYLPKWIAYGAYPVHLLLYYLISLC